MLIMMTMMIDIDGKRLDSYRLTVCIVKQKVGWLVVFNDFFQ
jgi:hypothetical protein